MRGIQVKAINLHSGLLLYQIKYGGKKRLKGAPKLVLAALDEIDKDRSAAQYQDYVSRIFRFCIPTQYNTLVQFSYD